MVGLVRRRYKNAVLNHILDDVTLSTIKTKTKSSMCAKPRRFARPLALIKAAIFAQTKICLCCENFLVRTKAFAHKKN
jgi:hypothetical protein